MTENETWHMRTFMRQTTIAIHLPPELLEQIDAVAKSTTRPRAAVIRSALRASITAAGEVPPCETCSKVRELVGPQ